ncbi:tetratricopeptide repeat protein [Methanosarcina horonobensis]
MYGLKKGNALYYLKRYEDALEAFDKAISIEPKNADLWLKRGNILKKS